MIERQKELSDREASLDETKDKLSEKEILLNIKEAELKEVEANIGNKAEANETDNEEKISSEVLAQREKEIEEALRAEFEQKLNEERRKLSHHENEKVNMKEEMAKLKANFQELHDIELANEAIHQKRQQLANAEKEQEELEVKVQRRRTTFVQKQQELEVEEEHLNKMEHIFHEKEEALQTGMKQLDEGDGFISKEMYVAQSSFGLFL